MPGLRVVRSNRVEALAEVLVQDLQDPAQRPVDPMAPVRIVVGSRGMERWLRHRLATGIGICANVAFPFPAAFLGEMLDKALEEDGASARSPWSQEALALAIVELLGQADGLSGPLQEIAGQTHTTAQQLSIADQVARVLDRYGVYRPALVRSWSGLHEPDPPRLPAHLEWQAQLWRRLAGRMDPSLHFAVRSVAARARLSEGGLGLKGPIRVFGFTSLPPAWVELLGEIARGEDVTLFVLCPSAVGWNRLHARAGDAAHLRTLDRELELPAQLDRDLAHPLDESLGRSARDMQLVLESLGGYHLDLGVDETQAHAQDGHSALHRLQSDIFLSRRPQGGTARLALEPEDRSIQFHACHGPARQVEVLRDVILGLLDEHPGLEPRDIVVMTPDIATYAPLLEGTFRQGAWHRGTGEAPWGESGTPRVPVEIADLTVRRTNPVADALLRVLEVADGRLTASAALDLLALEPVAARFGLGPEAVGRLREIVVQSGIRWGLDAEDRARSGQSPDPQNTFHFGLDRLALGVAMADEGAPVRLDPSAGPSAPPLAPWDDAEHGQTLDLLGRFFDFCQALSSTIDSLRSPRPLLEWITHLSATTVGTLDRLTLTEGASEWLTQRVRTKLEEVRAQAEAAQSARPMGLDALRALLEGRFEVASALTREQTGAVTCCAMLPMRTVPYRVVCLLGMDEGSFPRRGALPAFDWTALSPRAGDRVPRDEDRLLLLEALLSARSHLVVLYTGRSVRTNEDQQPCVPVAELQDAVDRTFVAPDGGDATIELTALHTLHAFDPDNFQAEPGPHRSFDPRLRAAAEAALGPPSDPIFLSDGGALHLSPREPETVIEIQALADFLAHPIRSLLEQRLGLRLREHLLEVEDQVPVELSAQAHRRIGRDLLHKAIDWMSVQGAGSRPEEVVEACMPAAIDHLRGAGQLPHGTAGTHVLASHRQALLRLSEELGDRLSAPEQLQQVRIPFTVAGRSVELVGPIPGVRGDAMIHLEGEADSTSGAMWWLIAPWIRFLAWTVHDPSAAGRLGMVHVTRQGGGKLQYRIFDPQWPVEAQQERARGILQWMVGAYLGGMDIPLPLFPRTSCQFAQAIRGHNASVEPGTAIGPECFQTPGQLPDARALEGPLDRARTAWGTPDSRAGDARDVHLAHVYGLTQPYLQDPHTWPRMPEPVFAAAALHMWLPLLTARSTPRTTKRFLEALDQGEAR